MKLIPKWLFEILVCPVCKATLKYNKNNTKLVCTKCKGVYFIKSGIPIMLPHEIQK